MTGMDRNLQHVDHIIVLTGPVLIRYLFHYICEDGLTYMCMADDSFGRRTPFAFLQDIKEKFLATYDRESALNAPIYGMNEFSKVIAKQMVCLSVRCMELHGYRTS